MRMMRNLKSWNAALCVALWALAVGSQAQTPTAELNLLANPDFQTTGWGIATGWNYASGSGAFSDAFFSGAEFDIVSQTLPTSDLYYYNIDFNLGILPNEGPVEFAVFWIDSAVEYANFSPSGTWLDYGITVTADGPTSDFGLMGNSAFWSSLDNLDVYWNGGIDPPALAADSPIGFGFEAAILFGLCGAAHFHRRREFCLARQEAA